MADALRVGSRVKLKRWSQEDNNLPPYGVIESITPNGNLMVRFRVFSLTFVGTLSPKEVKKK